MNMNTQIHAVLIELQRLLLAATPQLGEVATEVLVELQSLLLAATPQPGGVSQDDPMTAVLGPRGEWTPTWLTSLNAAIRARFPAGYSNKTYSDGGVQKPYPLQLISAFMFYPCLERTDLTLEQRQGLVDANNLSFFAASTGDPNAERLKFISRDAESASDKPVAFVACLHQSHRDPVRLQELVRTYYADYGYVSD